MDHPASPLACNLSPERLSELARHMGAELGCCMDPDTARSIASHVLEAA